jgi:hypothetical protein
VPLEDHRGDRNDYGREPGLANRTEDLPGEIEKGNQIHHRHHARENAADHERVEPEIDQHRDEVVRERRIGERYPGRRVAGDRRRWLVAVREDALGDLEIQPCAEGRIGVGEVVGERDERSKSHRDREPDSPVVERTGDRRGDPRMRRLRVAIAHSFP